MLLSQQVACAGCERDLRKPRRSLDALRLYRARTDAEFTKVGRRTKKARDVPPKTHDFAPSIHVFAHAPMTHDVAINMTAELARLQQSVKKDPNKKRPIRNTSRIWVPQVFRFLDLPSEVRNEIYEYFIRKDSVLRLRSFKLPVICRTSRQLRQESLPLFFARNHFVAEIRTNFEGVSVCPTHGSHTRYIDANDKQKCKDLGKLDLSNIIQRMLAICDSRTIRIRHIDFCMVAASARVRREQNYRYAILSVRRGQPHQICSLTKEGPNHEYTEQLRRILAEGKELLGIMVADSSYSGLSMRQLREVASTFVLDPAKRFQDWKIARLKHNLQLWRCAIPSLPVAKVDVVDQTGTGPVVPKALGVKQTEQENCFQPNQDAAKGIKPQSAPQQQIGCQETDEYGLEDAESYFLDCDYTSVPAESNSASIDTQEVDEFDMPEAECYFAAKGAVDCCAPTSKSGQSSIPDQSRQRAVTPSGEADVDEFDLVDAEIYFA